jgi:hypothetical protein
MKKSQFPVARDLSTIRKLCPAAVPIFVATYGDHVCWNAGHVLPLLALVICGASFTFRISSRMADPTVPASSFSKLG